MKPVLRISLTLLLLAVGCDRRGAAPLPADASATPAPATNRVGPTPAPATQATDELPDYVTTPVIDPADSPRRMRVVSAAPVLTEVIYALGRRECLVGRTRYCEYPPEAASVPAIGALGDTSVELILALQPDLVLISGSSRSITERLAPLGLRLEWLPDASLLDLFSTIRRVGELLECPRGARRLCEQIEADLARVDQLYSSSLGAESSSASESMSSSAPAAASASSLATAAARTPRGATRVLLLAEPLPTPPRPPFAAGPGSFYDDLLRRAGCVNVIEQPGAFAPLSLEFIIRADPDAIIELDPDGAIRAQGQADALRAWEALAPLGAVRAARVHVLRGAQHFLAGPRVAHTYAALRRHLSQRKIPP